MTSQTKPTVGAMLDALGFDRTDHDGAVRAALEELSLRRADVERLRHAIGRFVKVCALVNTYANHQALCDLNAALQPQTRGER